LTGVPTRAVGQGRGRRRTGNGEYAERDQHGATVSWSESDVVACGRRQGCRWMKKSRRPFAGPISDRVVVSMDAPDASPLLRLAALSGRINPLRVAIKPCRDGAEACRPKPCRLRIMVVGDSDCCLVTPRPGIRAMPTCSST
jgi:hypothetical protein